MTTNSQLSRTEPKNKNNIKSRLGKQLEQEKIHRNGDHMDCLLYTSDAADDSIRV